MNLAPRGAHPRTPALAFARPSSAMGEREHAHSPTWIRGGETIFVPKQTVFSFDSLMGCILAYPRNRKFGGLHGGGNHFTRVSDGCLKTGARIPAAVLEHNQPSWLCSCVSPADAAAFLRCHSDIGKSRWAAGRPWSYHRRVCVQALNSLRLIDLVPRIHGWHPQAAIESVFVIDGDQEQVLASRTPGPGAAFRSHSPP